MIIPMLLSPVQLRTQNVAFIKGQLGTRRDMSMANGLTRPEFFDMHVYSANGNTRSCVLSAHQMGVTALGMEAALPIEFGNEAQIENFRHHLAEEARRLCANGGAAVKATTWGQQHANMDMKTVLSSLKDLPVYLDAPKKGDPGQRHLPTDTFLLTIDQLRVVDDEVHVITFENGCEKVDGQMMMEAGLRVRIFGRHKATPQKINMERAMCILLTGEHAYLVVPQSGLTLMRDSFDDPIDGWTYQLIANGRHGWHGIRLHIIIPCILPYYYCVVVLAECTCHQCAPHSATGLPLHLRIAHLDGLPLICWPAYAVSIY
jgi:hypothetical protein